MLTLCWTRLQGSEAQTHCLPLTVQTLPSIDLSAPFWTSPVLLWKMLIHPFLQEALPDLLQASSGRLWSPGTSLVSLSGRVLRLQSTNLESGPQAWGNQTPGLGCDV